MGLILGVKLCVIVELIDCVNVELNVGLIDNVILGVKLCVIVDVIDCVNVGLIVELIDSVNVGVILEVNVGLIDNVILGVNVGVKLIVIDIDILGVGLIVGVGILNISNLFAIKFKLTLLSTQIYSAIYFDKPTIS